MKPAMFEGETSPIPAGTLPSDVEEHLPATRIELAGLQRLGAGYVRLRRLVRGARQGTVGAVRLLPQAQSPRRGCLSNFPRNPKPEYRRIIEH